MASFSNELKAKCRALFEIQGYTFSKISNEVGGEVSPKTIGRWAKRQGWMKNASQAEISQQILDSALEIANEIGCGREFQIRKAYELANARELPILVEKGDSVGTITVSIDSNNVRVSPDGEKSIEYNGNFYDLGQSVPDYKTQEKGLKVLMDLTGTKELPKKEKEDLKEQLDITIIRPKKKALPGMEIEVSQ